MNCMKKMFLTTMIIATAIIARSQYIALDAFFLKSRSDPETNYKIVLNKEVKELLAMYFPDKDTNSINANFLDTQPFLKGIFTDLSAHTEDVSTFHRLVASAGRMDVTNIADGLARFLIKRGKEELSVAFFNQFKKFLNNHDECRILFPNTVLLLDKIDTYKYATFLENLNNSFHADLSHLIIHLNQVIDLPKYETWLAHHAEIKLVIGTSAIVSELSQAGKSITPDSIITQLSSLPWQKVSNNLGNSLKLLNLISQSIRADSARQQIWLPLSELNQNLFADSITLRLYFGLFYQKAKQERIAFYSNGNEDTINVTTILAAQENHIYRISGMVENFSLLANDVQSTIENFKAKKEKGILSKDDYYTYIDKSINIINYGFQLVNNLRIPSSIQAVIGKNKYIETARNASYLYKNIYTKNYNSAVMNVCSILDSLLPDESTKKLIPGLLKYGNFMATVIKAESPEDVQAAIEAAALPAGSSSIKKNSAFNISLNAYIGGYFGRSLHSKADIDGNNSSVGVTAPLGFAFSCGLGHFRNGASVGALSLYGTLIDVGAVAGYRLNNDSTALEQKVTLGEIFTPGAYLVYGIGLPFLSYLPLSIGYGWQYGSRLYNRGNGKLTISNSSRWRSNWFVGIDIPLANFWTKNHGKK